MEAIDMIKQKCMENIEQLEKDLAQKRESNIESIEMDLNKLIEELRTKIKVHLDRLLAEKTKYKDYEKTRYNMMLNCPNEENKLKDAKLFDLTLANSASASASTLTATTPKTKKQRIEDKVAKELLSFEITKNLIRNHVVKKKSGCLKRPDFCGYIGNNQFIIIEVDEHQHQNYDKDRERKRMHELYEVVKRELNEQLLIIIRFNPHAFEDMDSGEKRKRSNRLNQFEQRINYLKFILNEINRMSYDSGHVLQKQFERDGFYVLYLYYNGFYEESSIENIKFDYYPRYFIKIKQEPD